MDRNIERLLIGYFDNKLKTTNSISELGGLTEYMKFNSMKRNFAIELLEIISPNYKDDYPNDTDAGTKTIAKFCLTELDIKDIEDVETMSNIRSIIRDKKLNNLGLL